MTSPELMIKVADWRRKALANELTLDEMKEAIRFLRGDRVSASYASEKSRAKKTSPSLPSADDLLSELGGL